MGRPRLYHTIEDEKAAAARRAKEHYKRNSKAICAHQRKKYHTRLAESPRATKTSKPAPTEEERKHKNRVKAKRSYERNKSTVQERRRVPRWRSSGVVEFDTTPHKFAAKGGGRDGRKKSLKGISNDIQQTFAGRTPVEIALERVKAFGANHDRDALIAVRDRFEGIMEDINGYKHNILNALGAGAHLAEAEELCGPVSNARHRHDVAFNAGTYPSIYYDALTLPTPNEHFDQETESRILDGKLVSNLVLIEVRNHRKFLVDYGRSGDSVVFVFSFNSFASFEAVRGCVSQLRGRDLKKRPVVAIIGTAAASTDREVNEAEVDDLKAALSMFYWDVDQEEDAFPVMDAIASAQRSYFVPSREEKPSGGPREKIVSALLSFLQCLSR
ncbi:hypothetical protein FA13DRAFT_1801177 [Coprinellus micaceus]|uniref:Uncharacterized protein n=1 Tax=Coprinellus micaceus TaxID=71717 RepID=A0A4Y7SEI9_COPMI|nr:hypothetical protein FA13DRAFT_1801177 [Coprinellus micaceus]